MSGKQSDRRPKGRKQSPAAPDREIERSRELETPGDGLLDEQTAAESGRRQNEDIFDDERSDRESGRPVQLDRDDGREGPSRGRVA